ncbi:NTP transferase domain-containing protein [Sneathiella limimaris]|uniref:NTP transferase domain-containing protein n=1 Tax=Sneathiella limimaris TaxID=1964213 RepID=UPI00146BB35C|nr:molybdopterin-binding/glycosyltransferase family 2 protein [Sneathiella limimaris]
MLSALKDQNVTEILAARLEKTDIPEDEAADTLARSFKGPYVNAEAPFTGRSNLIADSDGVVCLNRSLLKEINRIDPSITLATLKNFEKVTKGQMVGTVKIIPFSTSADFIEQALLKTGKADQHLISIVPFQQKKIAVISTRLPQTSDKLIQKSEQVLEDRLKACQNQILSRHEVEHHEAKLAPLIRSVAEGGADLILIFGASAITDIRDVVPAAVKEAGGQIDHFGMPVDPGNLLLLGKLGSSIVIGLPGCTRSPKFNGFDWVLERILADIPVTADDITELGEGGLLKEIASRPQPRSRKPRAEKQKSYKIGALLLAAGQSRRMGKDNKLLAVIDGKPMVRHVAETLKVSGLSPILMVTGHEADEVIKTVWDLGINTCHNPNYSNGLSTTLKVGFETLSPKVDGIIVCLGDMPFVTPEILNKLIAAFDPDKGKSIVIPTFNGKRGNPVLLSSQYWDEIQSITGDLGAKAIISAHEHSVEQVEIDTQTIFTDIDTPETLATYTDQIN